MCAIALHSLMYLVLNELLIISGKSKNMEVAPVHKAISRMDTTSKVGTKTAALRLQ